MAFDSFRRAPRASRPARLRRAAIALALSSCAALASAQTLRWASQGDAQTMDPHSQNESLTNQINAQVLVKPVEVKPWE